MLGSLNFMNEKTGFQRLAHVKLRRAYINYDNTVYNKIQMNIF